jgi:oxalate decarboxylase/phosphoglucose isomerase-like protein (cupin superfamily)
VVEKGQEILVPKNCGYRFHNTGAVPLIIVRFGADKEHAAESRPSAEGNGSSASFGGK